MVDTSGMSIEQAAKAIAQEIGRDPDTQQSILGYAHEIAEAATQAADSIVGDQHNEAPYFGTKVYVGKYSARAFIWAANGAAIHAERKAGVLVKAAAEYGTGHEGRHSKPKTKK